MTIVRVSGTYDVAWPEAVARVNPPLDSGAGIDLMDDLATSAAVGALASAAGFPVGDSLRADVVRFLDEHLPDTALSESAGVLGTIGRTSAKVGGYVERKATGLLTAIADRPALVATLLAGGVGLSLGATYLSSRAAIAKSELDAKTQFALEAVGKVPPAELAKLAAGIFGEPSSGPGVGSVLLWGGVAVALLVGLSLLRGVTR